MTWSLAGIPAPSSRVSMLRGLWELNRRQLRLKNREEEDEMNKKKMNSRKSIFGAHELFFTELRHCGGLRECVALSE